MRRSSNAGSCNCTRTASPRARSGRSATSRVPPCTGGCGGPQQRFDQGGRQPHAGAERADRVEGAQPPVGDGGGCFRTSGAGIRTKAEAIRSDAGRCPVSAQYRILGVAKSTYCWMLGHPEAERVDPPMRVTRSACGATAARSMGQEDQARPGACGHRHVAPPRQPDHEGRGHGGLVFEGPVPAASGQAERRSGPEHPRPRIRWLRPRTRTSPPTRPTWGGVGSSWACICLPGELANREIAGHAVGTRRDADLVPAAFAALRFPLGGIEVFHTDRGGEFTGERIERMLDVFGITRFLSNPGSPYDDAVVESTNRLIRRSSYTPTRTRAWNNCARTPTGTYGGTTTSGSTRPSDT